MSVSQLLWRGKCWKWCLAELPLRRLVRSIDKTSMSLGTKPCSQQLGWWSLMKWTSILQLRCMFLRAEKILLSEQPLNSIIWSKLLKSLHSINQWTNDHIGELSVRTNNYSNISLCCGARARAEVCLVFLRAFEQTTSLWWVSQANYFFTKSLYCNRVQDLLLVWL